MRGSGRAVECSGLQNRTRYVPQRLSTRRGFESYLPRTNSDQRLTGPSWQHPCTAQAQSAV